MVAPGQVVSRTARSDNKDVLIEAIHSPGYKGAAIKPAESGQFLKPSLAQEDNYIRRR